LDWIAQYVRARRRCETSSTMPAFGTLRSTRSRRLPIPSGSEDTLKDSFGPSEVGASKSWTRRNENMECADPGALSTSEPASALGLTLASW